MRLFYAVVENAAAAADVAAYVDRTIGYGVGDGAGCGGAAAATAVVLAPVVLLTAANAVTVVAAVSQMTIQPCTFSHCSDFFPSCSVPSPAPYGSASNPVSTSHSDEDMEDTREHGATNNWNTALAEAQAS